MHIEESVKRREDKTWAKIDAMLKPVVQKNLNTDEQRPPVGY
jgi:hypothetical protein